MIKKRKQYSPEFKAKVARAALNTFGEARTRRFRNGVGERAHVPDHSKGPYGRNEHQGSQVLQG